MIEYKGIWYREGDFEAKGINGRIEIVNGNLNIDFERTCIFPNSTFISKQKDGFIKVYCKEGMDYGKGKARAIVIFNKLEDEKNTERDEINGIEEVYFTIDNLHTWISFNEFKQSKKENENFIILKDDKDDNETIKLEYDRYKPVIHIEYKKFVNICRVEDNIFNITNFFSILIGRIDGVSDIGFKVHENNDWFGYYTDKNYTQFAYTNLYSTNLRTKYNILSQKLSFYYKNWMDFYNKNDLSMIYYFYMHKKEQELIVEQFIIWCKIFESLSAKEDKTDDNAQELRRLLKEVLQENSVKNPIKVAFESIGSKYNERQISNWIANGYLNRKSFGDRLKKICEGKFDFITEYKYRIVHEEDEDIYIKINTTRNYYTHLKKDKNGVMEERKIYILNNLLFVSFLSIVLSKLKFSEEDIEKIIEYDDVRLLLY